MATGIPVSRDLVFVLQSGEVVFDWGNGRVQDILTGDFIPFQESDYGRGVTDADLDILKNNARVDHYDTRIVFLRPLPEPPRKTME